MTFFGFGRNSGGVRPPDDAELERRRRALGERYYGLDRTPTMDATGGVRPPAGLFQNAGEASDYLGYRARRTVGAQPLPIETPTTAATVAEFRGGGVAERPPAEMGGGGGVVDGLLRGAAVRPERPAFDETAADRAMGAMGMGPPPAAPVFNLNIGGAAMPPAAAAPRMDDLGGAGMPRAERPPDFAQGASTGKPTEIGGGARRVTPLPQGARPPAAAAPAAGGVGSSPAEGAGGAGGPDGQAFHVPEGMKLQRHKESGGYRLVPLDGSGTAAPGARREVRQQYSAAPAAGAFRDEQIRAGLVQPGAGEDRERELRRQGLVQRAGNTGLSAAARAAAQEELTGMEREDAGKNALELGKTRAAAAAAQAQAEAAGKSPIFDLPGGKKGVLVGNTLVDATTGDMIADGRSLRGNIDPQVWEKATPAERAEMLKALNPYGIG